ncbi:hypothetical protein BDZ91DRAFT_768250 [Kalaharituber pfeilii]|nr:hypothetical protein BDZ91DRAFT_768250 [Kalaharituber pfeilii]
MWIISTVCGIGLVPLEEEGSMEKNAGHGGNGTDVRRAKQAGLTPLRQIESHHLSSRLGVAMILNRNLRSVAAINPVRQASIKIAQRRIIHRFQDLIFNLQLDSRMATKGAGSMSKLQRYRQDWIEGVAPNVQGIAAGFMAIAGPSGISQLRQHFWVFPKIREAKLDDTTNSTVSLYTGGERMQQYTTINLGIVVAVCAVAFAAGLCCLGFLLLQRKNVLVRSLAVGGVGAAAVPGACLSDFGQIMKVAGKERDVFGVDPFLKMERMQMVRAWECRSRAGGTVWGNPLNSKRFPELETHPGELDTGFGE